MPEKQQVIQDPAIPSECEPIEQFAQKFVEAKSRQVAAQRDARAAYESLKALMTENGWYVYRCLQTPYIVELKHRDDEIKVKEQKADEE